MMAIQVFHQKTLIHFHQLHLVKGSQLAPEGGIRCLLAIAPPFVLVREDETLLCGKRRSLGWRVSEHRCSAQEVPQSMCR